MADYLITELAEKCVELTQQAKIMDNHVGNAIKSKLGKGDLLQDKSFVQLQICQDAIKNVVAAFGKATVALQAASGNAPEIEKSTATTNSM